MQIARKNLATAGSYHVVKMWRCDCPGCSATSELIPTTSITNTFLFGHRRRHQVLSSLSKYQVLLIQIGPNGYLKKDSNNERSQ